jgi:Bacillithiol biosynthesis BshC
VLVLTEQDNRPPAHQIYSDYIYSRRSDSLATDLWGMIPRTLGEAAKLLPKIRAEYTVSPELETLQRVMKRNLKKMGVLTGETSEAIDAMGDGVVEGGQQPMLMGGPSLILNKIAYATSLAKEASMVPLYYVADYDGVQAELTNMRLPSPSSRGLQLSYPVQPNEENMSIYEMGVPDEDWFGKTLEKIESNYRGILKDVEAGKREEIQRNLSQAYMVLKYAYYSSVNVSGFSTKVVSSLLNLEAGLGVPVYWFSMPETRSLFIEGYELLLKEPNRSRFIEVSNVAAERVESAGYRSQIGLRGDDYVPFFLECMNPQCRRIRVELKYRRELGSSNAILYGKCPVCGEEYSFSVDASEPDVSEIIDWITPRVDSRQVIVDSVLPIVAHIGGPGETSYYAEVIPAVKALGLPFPIFMRYTRTFYNTPWNENMASGLKKESIPVITGDDLFRHLSAWVEARNSDDSEGIWSAHQGIEQSIDSTFSDLVDRLSSLESEVAEIKEKLREPGDRRPLVEAMKRKQSEAQVIDNYLSWAFGRFSPEKFGQEVNWLWLDLAAANGVEDLMGVFLRQYNRDTPNSSMFFVNIT